MKDTKRRSKKVRRRHKIVDFTSETTPDDLCFLVAYSLKNAAEMKQIKVSPDNPAKFGLENDKKVSGRLAVQMARIKSYVTPYDVLFAVGQGKHIRRAFKTRMLEWERTNQNRKPTLSPFDLDAFWRSVSKRNPKARLGESNIRASYPGNRNR